MSKINIFKFRFEKANGTFRYFADCLGTMFVEVLVAFIWHDLWFIHDSNIFPDDLFYSALTSLVSIVPAMLVKEGGP